MPEWSIVITGPKGSAKFTPNPQPVFSGDLVSWSNQTDDAHTIVIDGQTGLAPMPAPSWGSSTPAFKVTTAVTYSCKDHAGESGSITIKTAVLLLALLTGIFAPSLKAQVQCGDLIGGELKTIPVIDRDDVAKEVRGTLVTTGEKQVIAFLKGTRVSGAITTANINCAEQWVRTYRKDAAAASQRPDAAAVLPQPGPTIRAKVGDLVELTFLNQIDPLNFPGTDTGKCDQTQGQVSAGPPPVNGPIYPQQDTEPNCFHGSVFTNVHFHGTHTSPNSTADNVFLQIVPTPRSKNNQRIPEVTADSVRSDFNKFFAQCKLMLNQPDSPQLWPKIWNDLPEDYRQTQDKVLEANNKDLFAANKRAIANGAFPQNYIGAFPYCYRIPVYTSASFPPAPMTEERSTHTAGAGSAEHDESLAPQRKLMMGQAPGTHWYHAHKHGSTTINVANGMTGVMIIEGVYDEEIKKAYAATNITEQVIVLNQIGLTPNREGGSEPSPGPYFSVNGRLQPTITMKPGEVQMWRIANTAGRTGTIFQLPAGLSWRQLAQDGVQFTDTNYKNSENKPFLLAAGNRADLLVKAPNQASATLPLTVNLTVSPSTNATTTQLLLNVKTGTTAQNMSFMDRSLTYWPPFLNDIQESEITGRKTIVFATDRNPAAPNFTNQTIDGKKFSGEVGALVLLNQVEEWKIENASYAPKIAHPFHIHVNPFQVVEVFDPNEKLADGTTPRYTTGTPAAGQCQINVNDKATWKPCSAVPPPSNVWRDVFSIPAGNVFGTTSVPGYFKMRSRFVDYPGYFVIHCHILAHEDRGMMTVVYVAPLQPPFSHH
jgi:FtsP/CotA-like multicopper oxidase with cupredoxin domain